MQDHGFDPAILDGIPLPALVVDNQSRILGANSRAVALNPQASENRPLILVFRQPGINEAVETCLKTGQAQRATYHHADGPQEHRYEVICSVVANGRQRAVMLCFRDTTEIRQLDQMRRDFVANVSHELRTPLTAILGFIETLQGPAKGDPVAQERFLSTMSAEASRMNRLVGDLLSLSRVEEVSRMRPKETVDLDAVVRSAERNLAPLAADGGSEIIYDRPAQPVHIPADSDQLLQVITNLIENALKYGGQGTQVHLSLQDVARATGVRGEAVVLTVKDNGPGIDAIHLPRLTERFYRIDSHRSREMGGTGLGLAIVKHIINRHRGRLEVESTLGEGTTFRVILPKN